jgi:4-hydroxy-4-methyl-2-oxoglutarate aldolase
VQPGDLVVGDDDGVAIVPLEHIEKVYKESVERMKKEETWLEKISKGQSSLDAVGLRKILDSMDIEYHNE